MNQLYLDLSNKYNNFIYDKFEVQETNNSIKVTYHFIVENLVTFTPSIEIDKKGLINNNQKFINTILFNIGLVELISYWKATCSKNIIVKAGYLDEFQITWFKKLYYNGLSEFFYRNDISTNIVDFVNMTCQVTKEDKYSINYNGHGNLIPIGGGKDSIVTLELLNHLKESNICFMINPKNAQLKTVETANYSDDSCIKIKRTLDKKIIELNNQGFLNGHTPFSALVAFISYLSAYLYNKEYIVLSNESSANEGNVIGSDVNHQYSKTYEFENDFNNYINHSLNSGIKYFSLLRPLSEFQIAKLFSKHKKYFNVFKSCNLGSLKEDWIWCCNCPKCLFIFTILSPFLYKEELINIFNQDLFERKDLLDTFIELTGNSVNKPFECVGTYEEINYAISLTINKLKDNKLPYLLNYYKENYKIDTTSDIEYRWNEENNLNEYFEKIVRDEINE